MEHHPLDKARIDADKRVADLLAALPAARIAEAAQAQGLAAENQPTLEEALAYLDVHEPASDGPVAAAYAEVIAAQAEQREAHTAWRDFLATCEG